MLDLFKEYVGSICAELRGQMFQRFVADTVLPVNVYFANASSKDESLE